MNQDHAVAAILPREEFSAGAALAAVRVGDKAMPNTLLCGWSRRRERDASRDLPPDLRLHFQPSQTVVLATVAAQVMARGACQLSQPELVRMTGLCMSTVSSALRTARLMGLIEVTPRPNTSEANVIRIASPEWLAWLRQPRKARR